MLPSRPPPPAECLLVLSDVHLGSDMSDGAPRRSTRVDADLIKLLDHYKDRAPAGTRFRLVIAGDFIDFIGMSVGVEGANVSTPPTEEERQHGLGNSEDHAREKMRLVGERHAEVFAALTRFVLGGHALTFVHGNHDIELHWQAVQDELLAALLRHTTSEESASELSSRVEHSPWFFYQDGVAYVEHGHQYDPFCAVDHITIPLSPFEPRRLARGFCDVLLRFVVRPMRGFVSEHGHDRMSAPDYLKIGLKLGVGGAFGLGLRFTRAIFELFKLRRAHLSDACAALRTEHERRVQLLSEAKRIGADRLRALCSLQEAPITRSIRGILASVLLDRIALGLLAALTLTILSVTSLHFALHSPGGLASSSLAMSAGLVLVAWLVAHRYLCSLRAVCPAERMQERAGKLAHLFPAAFVVMGHTHVPVRAAVADTQSTYVNLGSWSEEEEHHHDDAAPRTHLVICPTPNGPSGELLVWRDGAPSPLALTS